jgi:hypothetical protein
MSNATDRPPHTPAAPSRGDATPAQDPSDLGTAYGMEMSIEVPKASPAEGDADDPLAWIRRWVERHKPV